MSGAAFVPSPLQVVMWSIAITLIVAGAVALHDWLERGLQRRRERLNRERAAR